MLPKYILNADSLVTKHDSVRTGFYKQAITKTEKATPFVEKAKLFHSALLNLKTLKEVITLKDYKQELLAAVGLSNKAMSHLIPDELDALLEKVIGDIIGTGNGYFREELVYRYLLTKGDALGGTMRNVIGSLASEKFIKALLKTFENKKVKIIIDKNVTGKVRSIAWNNRYLVFDYKPKIIDKNIDLILVNTGGYKYTNMERKFLENPEVYIACGELKGGIDPAGADEHWKTANSALGRIRDYFSTQRNRPELFFICAAIESSMANEIYSQLEKHELSFAANLNVDNQVEDLANWLSSL